MLVKERTDGYYNITAIVPISMVLERKIPKLRTVSLCSIVHQKQNRAMKDVNNIQLPALLVSGANDASDTNGATSGR